MSHKLIVRNSYNRGGRLTGRGKVRLEMMPS